MAATAAGDNAGTDEGLRKPVQNAGVGTHAIANAQANILAEVSFGFSLRWFR